MEFGGTFYTEEEIYFVSVLNFMLHVVVFNTIPMF